MNRKRLAAAACLLLFGTAFHLSHLLVHDELIYYSRGVRTQGTVREKRKEARASGRTTSTSWHIVYDFEVNGTTHSRKDMLDVGRGYDSLIEGQSIDVVYDPHNPNVNRSELSAPYVRYTAIIFFVFAMAGMLAFVPVRILRQKRS